MNEQLRNELQTQKIEILLYLKDVLIILLNYNNIIFIDLIKNILDAEKEFIL
jgi:hypothetical protein